MTADLPPIITRFLVTHQELISSSSLVAEELIVTFKDETTKDDILACMVDLIVECRPVTASLIEHRTIRLGFDVH